MISMGGGVCVLPHGPKNSSCSEIIIHYCNEGMRTRKKGQYCASMRVCNKHTNKYTNKIISGNGIKLMKLVNVIKPGTLSFCWETSSRS